MALLEDVARALIFIADQQDIGPQELIEGLEQTDEPEELVAMAFDAVEPFGAVSDSMVDLAEEFIVAPLVKEGQLTPTNIEDKQDELEGNAAAIIAGTIAIAGSIETLSGGQIDELPDEIFQGIAALGFDDVTGREIDARLQEGVDPALKQKVHADHRSKQADFQDWTEANKRAKWTDGDLPTRTGDVPEAVRDLYSPQDFGYLPDPDTYGTIPDQTDLFEYVGLEHLEPEEIVEEAPQKGVMPSRAAMEQVLHTSGLPEDVKQVYLDLWGNIPQSMGMIEESIRMEEPIREIDRLVFDNVMPPKQAVAFVRSDIEAYVRVSAADGDPQGPTVDDAELVAIILSELKARWDLLASLPNSAPDASDLTTWYEQGQISLEQFNGLWQTFGELGAFWAVYAKETIIDQGEDDIRKAHVLGRLTTGEAMFRLRQQGYTDEQASQILAGADPDTLVLQEAQEEQTVGSLPASSIDGISESDQTILSQVGLGTIAAIAGASVEELVQTGVVSDATAQKAIGQAQRLLEQAG